jgi:branched-chain amino acid transport system ATP-binding protein
MSEILLETKNLSKHYGGLAANCDVNIRVMKGEILGIIGANGAGKTTLFNLLSGTEKPSKGIIEFNGKRIDGQKANRVCKAGIGRTYQIVQPFTNLSVIDNIMVGAFLRHPKINIAREKAEETVELCGLSEIRDKKGKDLTLTQMKRMEVAKALATEPQLLLLDEVTAGVNPNEHSAFMNLIQKIRDSGITIVMIEHVMRVIMNISERMYVLNQGKVIAEGKPEEVAKNQQVINSYFGEKWNAENK